MAGRVSVWALGALLAAGWPLLGTEAAASPAPVAVVVGPGDQTAPSVSAGQLAYADDSSGARQVWVKDLASGAATRYSGAQAVEGGPVLDHGILAFAVASGVQVVAFGDPGASAAVQAPGAAGVSASAQLVTWEQPGAGGRDVAFLLVGTTAPVVLGAAGDEHGPFASYGWMAWLDESGSGAIRLRDPAGALTTPYPTRAREIALWASSRLTAPLLAAVVDGAAGGAELLVLDPSGAIRGRLARPAEVRRPRLGNEWVAFEDLATGTSQVSLWQWTTGRLVVPAPTGQPQLLNDLRIEDQVMRLAWADGRSGNLDVYLFEATLPLPDLPQGQARCDDALAPVLADLLVRRERGQPTSQEAVISLSKAAPVLVCVDAQGTCAGWVTVGGQEVATPSDFGGGPCVDHRPCDHHHDGDHHGGHHHDGDHHDGDHHGGHHHDRDHDGRDHDGRDHDGRDHDGRDHDGQRGAGHARTTPSPPDPTPPIQHLETRLDLPAGDSIAWARVASERHATIRVRVLADGWASPPRSACVAGVDCPPPGPPGTDLPGCASAAPGGLLGLLLIPLLLGRVGRRRRH